MNDKERNTFIMESLNRGLSLSDVQGALASEHGIRMTYLELRMLAGELQVDWKKQDKPVAKVVEPAQKAEGADEEVPGLAGAELADAAASGGGGTRVTVSKLVRPGAMYSGDVVFASGAKGEWHIDNYGRPGLSLAEGSSKPTREDMEDFSVELQKALGY